MKRYNTLVEALRAQSDTSNAIRFIGGENSESIVSFGELWSRACQFLASLQSSGMKPGVGCNSWWHRTCANCRRYQR